MVHIVATMFYKSLVLCYRAEAVYYVHTFLFRHSMMKYCTFLYFVHRAFELYIYNNQHNAPIRYFISVILRYVFRSVIRPIIKSPRIQCGRR
jgi:hypothetical protein